MLARHGYGVLLFDRRGEGESEGDPNVFGWHGERDVHAAGGVPAAPRRRGPRADRRHRLLGRRRDAASRPPPSRTPSRRRVRGRRRASIREDIASRGVSAKWLAAPSMVAQATGALREQPAAAGPEEPGRRTSRRGRAVRLRREGPGGRGASSTSASRRGRRAQGDLGDPGRPAHRRHRAQPRAYERRVIAFFDRHLRAER